MSFFDFWVHPLPPDGPVTFVASWPEYGAPRPARTWTGRRSVRPAARAVILRPEEPESEAGGSRPARRLGRATLRSPDTGSGTSPRAAIGLRGCGHDLNGARDGTTWPGWIAS